MDAVQNELQLTERSNYFGRGKSYPRVDKTLMLSLGVSIIIHAFSKTENIVSQLIKKRYKWLDKFET